ncbi:MAG TPA: glycosyltransferase [Vicinamibacterales bacterium]|nr:glycosyltransferase [Vicinamibacterales bacterium]
MTRVLFVNSGLLGQRTFALFVDRAFRGDTEIVARQIVLSDDLTAFDRVVRRALCVRLAPNGGSRFRNLDLFRYRSEWRGADLFVLPTRDEAFGVAFQEAAAAGLPAIGTRLNAVPELVDDGATGRLVAPRDRAALAAALSDLIGDPTRRRAMGAQARATIVRTAHPDIYRSRLAIAIRRVTGGR